MAMEQANRLKQATAAQLRCCMFNTSSGTASMLKCPQHKCLSTQLGSPTLALCMQIDFKEVFLKILEKCGLCRSHGGSALVLTGRDVEEHIPTEDPATMPTPELAKIYTVSGSSHKLVTRLYFAEPSWLARRPCLPECKQPCRLAVRGCCM